MKKKLAVVLCLVMVFMLALTGCGESSKLVGKWEAKVDLTEFLKEDMDNEMLEFIDIDDFSIVLVMEFDKDGTYERSVDEDAFEDSIENVKKSFKKGMTKYFEDLIDEQGLDMTVEEVLEMSDTDMDEVIDQAFDKDMWSEMTEAVKCKGQYKAEDGKIYMSVDEDDEPDDDMYWSYELDGDEFEVTKEKGFDEDEELGEEILPLTFVKAD